MADRLSWRSSELEGHLGVNERGSVANSNCCSISMMRPLMTHGARRWRTLGLLPAIVASLVIPRVVTAETVTLAPTQDAWIDQVNQNTSHGADTELNVKARSPQKRRALVQFDLSSIPACANISSATLTLHADSNSLATTLQHDVDRVTEAWTEGQVTWLSRDGTNPWSTQGGTMVYTSTQWTGASVGLVSWDVTSDVASFVNGAAANNGWCVKAKSEVNLDTNVNNTVVQYASRETETEANRPELEVTYTLEDANCNDSDACTDDLCTANGCTHTPVVCDDGIFCNGAETCDPIAGCQPGVPPTCSDGVACTTDICDPQADSCQHTPVNAACDDGVFCNGVETCDPIAGCQPGVPPTCSDGVDCTTDICDPQTDSCQHTPVNAACDDGNVCTIDTCDPGTGCVYTPGNAGVVCRVAAGECDVDDTCSGSSADCTDAKKTDGTQCDDGNPDTISDTCESGVCGGIGIEELCPTQPIAEDNCHQSPRNIILIKKGASNARNQLKWQWKIGDATDASEFGDPAASTYTTLCVYDSTGLVLSATVPPVGLCPKGHKTQPCWTSLKKGTAWKYVDTSGAHDGVTVVRLTSASSGKAKILWKMKGANLAMPGLPLDQSQQPVTVQVENIQNGDHKCWSAQYYGPPVRGKANIFLDKNP
jgi:hypothetical protein